MKTRHAVDVPILIRYNIHLFFNKNLQIRRLLKRNPPNYVCNIDKMGGR